MTSDTPIREVIAKAIDRIAVNSYKQGSDVSARIADAVRDAVAALTDADVDAAITKLCNESRYYGHEPTRANDAAMKAAERDLRAIIAMRGRGVVVEDSVVECFARKTCLLCEGTTACVAQDGSSEAAIAADHQWRAEHAPAAVKQAVDDYGNAFHRAEQASASLDRDPLNSEAQLELIEAQDEWIAAEAKLLALYQRPVIDEAAVELAFRAFNDAAFAQLVGAVNPVKERNAHKVGIRAALEAFVAGGEG